jgi:hypothetical protein
MAPKQEYPEQQSSVLAIAKTVLLVGAQASATSISNFTSKKLSFGTQKNIIPNLWDMNKTNRF